jgi:hypothetical protein
MASMHCSITTLHVDAIDASSCERSKYVAHASMIQIGEHPSASGFVGDMIKASSGKICKEDMCVA